MTRLEFIKLLEYKLIQKYPDLKPQDIEILLEKTLTILSSSLEQHERIELRKFGVFKIKRISRINKINPLTGKKIEDTSTKYVPKFKPSKLLTEQIKNGK